MIERKNVTYECEICGNLFDNKQECEECEESHIVDFSERSIDELTGYLIYLKQSAHGYRMGKTTMGIHTRTFINLMDETIKKLGDKE